MQSDSPSRKMQKSRTFNQEDTNAQWGEFKIDGSNIASRAYAAISIHANILYVHGGYQVSQGILGSFYSMQLNRPQYKWTEIRTKVNPGPLTKHSMFVYQDALYILGGQTSTTSQSNITHRFDVQQQAWTRLPINKTYPSPFDNHAAVKFDETVAIFGGYSQGRLGDTLHLYHIAKNEWTSFKSTAKHLAPSAREGCGLTYGQGRLYLFGGTNGQSRLNDIWLFDLKLSSWRSVHMKTDINPSVRNGFVFEFWRDKLVLFGGIHDITWELDDLWTFDIGSNCWRQWEGDQTRLVESPSPLKRQTVSGDESMNQTQKSMHKTHGHSFSPHRTQTNRKSTLGKGTLKTMPTQISEQKNRHRTLDDQRKKEFENRKMDMLRLFEVDDQQADQMRSMSPTSETMRNALLLIGNPVPKQQKTQRLTDFGKETVSKFMLPLNNVSNTFFGKRPCARDGHKGTVYDHYLIIFGGDRHQMSFNDIHALDLASVE